MLSDGLLNPWKMGASLPPVLYGVLLFLKMPQAGLWLTMLVVLMLSALWYIARVDYSLWAILPALAGGFLLFTCVAALAQGYNLHNFVPLSSTRAELWLCAALGLAYVVWGVRETHKAGY